jgi:hypothetical protein
MNSTEPVRGSDTEAFAESTPFALPSNVYLTDRDRISGGELTADTLPIVCIAQVKWIEPRKQVKEDWIRKLVAKNEVEGENRRLEKQNATERDRLFHTRIEGLWVDVVTELESTIRQFNQICPPKANVSFKRERFSFTASKERTDSSFNILSVRLDVETKQILSFQRSNTFFEVKVAGDDLYVVRPDGTRIGTADLAKEILSELFLTP